MFVEERIYTVHPGRTKDFPKLYEEEVMEIQPRHLQKLIGYHSSEIGTLNQVRSSVGVR
ncbi:hypothetical protein P3T20_001216 [Paraburkholderia sp. GAS206C]|jgi:hypothetical protein|uniref:NIPSNAP family protein n=1 Tax=unclassified Paraburkholderia TaxID=2615204 RepID=UPI003D259169